MSAAVLTLEELAAREAIRDLYARYADALDHDDYDAVADCLTDDAAFRMSDRSGSYGGKPEILRLLRSVAANRPRHVVTGLVFDRVEETVADCRASMVLVDVSSGAIVAIGDYRDRFVTEPDGPWRLARREIAFRWRTDGFAGRPAPDGAA